MVIVKNDNLGCFDTRSSCNREGDRFSKDRWRIVDLAGHSQDEVVANGPNVVHDTGILHRQDWTGQSVFSGYRLSSFDRCLQGSHHRIEWHVKVCPDFFRLNFRTIIDVDFKGRRLFGEILVWAKDHAGAKHLRFIRMDTWADNPLITSYYEGFGFKVVDHVTAPDSPDLGFQYRNLALTLLEMDLTKQV